MKTAFNVAVGLTITSVVGAFGCFIASIWLNTTGQVDPISSRLAATGAVLSFIAVFAGAGAAAIYEALPRGYRK